MRGVATVLVQTVTSAVALAVLGGVVGLLIAEVTHKGAATGAGWGMIVAGGLAALVVGGSGSPSENLVRGRAGFVGTYWGQSAAIPQSPLQIALGGMLAFGAGIGVLALFAY